MVMGRNQTFLVLPVVLFFALAIAQTLSAATFTYYSSSLFSQSGAYASYYEPGGTLHEDDPGAVVSWDTREVESDQRAEVADNDFVATASGQGFGSAEVYENALEISLNGSVSGSSMLYGSHIESYGGASTVQAAYSTGIFFEITPEPGEDMGDPVQVSFYWEAEAWTSSGTSARLDGGFAGDTIAITMNDCPAPESFDPAKAVWTYDGIILDAEDGFYDAADGYFSAAIGDIVGIHMDASVELNWYDEADDLEAEAYQSLSLEVNPAPVPAPGALWLLGSGLCGLWAIKRKG
jgi:hypothetical protein